MPSSGKAAHYEIEIKHLSAQNLFESCYVLLLAHLPIFFDPYKSRRRCVDDVDLNFYDFPRN